MCASIEQVQIFILLSVGWNLSMPIEEGVLNCSNPQAAFQAWLTLLCNDLSVKRVEICSKIKMFCKPSAIRL